MGLWEKTIECLKKVSPENEDIYNIKETLKGLAKKDGIKTKDPKLAGVLSVLPGAGHLYCERPRDMIFMG